MDDRIINVLVTSFPGLGLPRTLSIPTKASTSVAELTSDIRSRIPVAIENRLILTTNRNKELAPTSQAKLSSLLPPLLDNDDDDDDDDEKNSSSSSGSSSGTQEGLILPLRLSAPLCGGKGGFGSQLRAAGGRMSTKRRKQSAEEQHASSRNLDGRRLRTVTEAKALAEYLATKPDMERKQKEMRRQRWEQVLEAAEKREQEIRQGGDSSGGKKGRVDGQWVEDKEEAGERTRDAVRAAMASGDYRDLTFSKDDDEPTTNSSEDGNDDSSASNNEEDAAVSGKSVPTSPEEAPADTKGKAKEAPKAYFGWNEDDEFMSEDDEEEGDQSSDGEAVRRSD